MKAKPARRADASRAIRSRVQALGARPSKPAMMKAELEAEVKRLQKSLKRSQASLGREKAKNIEAMKSLAEAHERETATAEILRVISRSPTNTKPVFEAIVSSGVHLFGGMAVTLRLIKEGYTERVASTRNPHLPTDNRLDVRRPIDGRGAIGQAIARREVVQVADVHAADYDGEVPLEQRQRFPWRAAVVAPLLRNGMPIGVLTVTREFPGPFSDKQIALLKTFADQAVIAIENVRLFKELQAKNTELTETLEQQTATADILKVISGSPTDTKPVFHAIAKTCQRLLHGKGVGLLLVRQEQIEGAALLGEDGGTIQPPQPYALDRGSVPGKSILESRVVHVPDYEAAVDEFPRIRELGISRGYRSGLYVPLLKDGKAIGTLGVRRSVAGEFTQKEIALLRTFADQAVIAIENARLFNETKEALEQQKVISGILQAISQSPTDTEPVFDAIVNSGLTLFEGLDVSLRLVRGKHHELVASTLRMRETADPFPCNDGSYPASRAMLNREFLEVQDIVTADWVNDRVKRWAERRGWRATFIAPMLRGGTAIGVIQILSPKSGPFTQKQISLLKTFADQAVIAIENVRLFKELEARNAELTESLEQQTVTSDILRIISRSPTDTQPVFDAIVKSGVELFSGMEVSLRLVRDDRHELVASTRARDGFVFSVSRDGMPTSRAILRKELVHVSDILTADWVDDEVRERAKRRGFRSLLCAPLMRGDEAIGTIAANRAAPGPFTDKQIALLQTFADQAVIAIENVRLFNETKEALERQTAISEILRVISSSPTDVQPVLSTVVDRAGHICQANDVRVWLWDGNLLRYVAGKGPFDIKVGRTWTLDRGLPVTRAVIDRVPVHVEDMSTSAAREEFPLGYEQHQRRGYRTFLAVPLLQKDRVLGALLLRRTEVRPFTDKQIDLLKTFADQAAIAIENVRLFKELQTKNGELTESLEQQTVTGEILRIMSRSPTDTQPVFDAIVNSGVRLFGGVDMALRLVKGDRSFLVAATRDDFRSAGGTPLDSSGNPAIRAIVHREIVHVEDVSAEDWNEKTKKLAHSRGVRAGLYAPLLRDDDAIGAISVTRATSGQFTNEQIALLKTFADQAVIAIENVRLFNETKEALEQQRVVSEILQAISTSPTDTQPVFDAIVNSGAKLFEGMYMGLRLVRGDFHERVATTINPSIPEATRGELRVPLHDPTRAQSRAIVRREVLQLPDILADETASERLIQQRRHRPFRAMLAVPLMRGSEAIGVISVFRKTPGPFTDKQIELLKTFANQAVIAIQNVRLFNEIQDKSHQLEIANLHKSEFLANMSHELRTPLNAVIGFSEVLQQGMVGELNEKQGEYVTYIHTSGSHLLSLINDILDLSKVEAGRMELDLTHFNVPMAIDNALTLVKERATRHGLTLECSLDPAVGQIDADERKFKQILLNLLSNAVKFTPEGGRITVSARAAINDTVEVSVTDTGIGIAPEDCEAVFEEFRQVGEDAERKAQGTGLGLALTKKFIELHGGRIWLTSTLGKGSTFSFTLPITQPEAQATA